MISTFADDYNVYDSECGSVALLCPEHVVRKRESLPNQAQVPAVPVCVCVCRGHVAIKEMLLRVVSLKCFFIYQIPKKSVEVRSAVWCAVVGAVSAYT